MFFIDKDKYRDSSGVYAITNIANGKVYVGQTTMRFVKRYWHHCWKLAHNEHDNCYLQNDYNTYGKEAFNFKVLAVLGADDDINIIEQQWIAFYRSLGCCYNIQDGGQEKNLGRFLSEESKRKIGEKNREHMSGRKLPEQTRLHMRESAHRGSDNMTAKLNELDVVEITNLINSGFSNREIAARYNVTHENIQHIRKGHTWSHITGFGRH